MITKPYLSVVVSAYNEAENLDRGSFNEALDYLQHQKYTWEVIVVNDGSTDSTLKKLQKIAETYPKVQVVDNPHMGKAMGIITGALKAQGNYTLLIDMDQSTPIAEAPKILSLLESGNDIVLGSRTGRVGAPAFRQVLALGMVILRGLILRLPFKDTQCGFKGYKTSAGQAVFKIMKNIRPQKTITGPAVDPGYDVEFLYLARKLGFKIAEIPVLWHYQESRRVSFVKDAIAGLRGLLLVRYRSILNLYGIKK